jgi:hypothetical protein
LQEIKNLDTIAYKLDVLVDKYESEIKTLNKRILSLEMTNKNLESLVYTPIGTLYRDTALARLDIIQNQKKEISRLTNKLNFIEGKINEEIF